MKTSKVSLFVVMLIVLSVVAGCAQPAATPAHRLRPRNPPHRLNRLRLRPERRPTKT